MLYFILIEPDMHDLISIVIPRVSSEWEEMAYALRYKVPAVKSIRSNHKGDVKQCCKELFEDWLSTSNGAKPKTWRTVLSKLVKVEGLIAVTEEIKEELIQMDTQH